MTIYVPSTVCSEDAKDLVSVIGLEKTLIFMGIYHSDTLYIPLCKKLTSHIRNVNFINEVNALVETGTFKDRAINLIARKYGITQRYGYRIFQLNKDHHYVICQ